jgi:uncharacterized protein with HEPN domain
MKPNAALRIREYLQHILDAIDRATSYVAEMDVNAFERDTRTQDAVIRSIEIIGEAAKRVRSANPEFATRHSHIPWDLMYDMRNRIVHDYFEIDLEVVWQTVLSDLPTLQTNNRSDICTARCRNRAARRYDSPWGAQEMSSWKRSPARMRGWRSLRYER